MRAVSSAIRACVVPAEASTSVSAGRPAGRLPTDQPAESSGQKKRRNLVQCPHGRCMSVPLRRTPSYVHRIWSGATCPAVGERSVRSVDASRGRCSSYAIKLVLDRHKARRKKRVDQRASEQASGARAGRHSPRQPCRRTVASKQAERAGGERYPLPPPYLPA